MKNCRIKITGSIAKVGQSSIEHLIGKEFPAKQDPEDGTFTIQSEEFGGQISIDKTECEIIPNKI